jgi:hypothetical protein
MSRLEDINYCPYCGLDLIGAGQVNIAEAKEEVFVEIEREVVEDILETAQAEISPQGNVQLETAIDRRDGGADVKFGDHEVPEEVEESPFEEDDDVYPEEVPSPY